MKKIAIITDKDSMSLFLRTAARIFKRSAVYYGTGIGTEDFMKHEQPVLVLTDFNEPVNGTGIDMLNLRSLDENLRLRVLILRPYKIKEITGALLPVINKLSFLNKFHLVKK